MGTPVHMALLEALASGDAEQVSIHSNDYEADTLKHVNQKYIHLYIKSLHRK